MSYNVVYEMLSVSHVIPDKCKWTKYKSAAFSIVFIEGFLWLIRKVQLIHSSFGALKSWRQKYANVKFQKPKKFFCMSVHFNIAHWLEKELIKEYVLRKLDQWHGYHPFYELLVSVCQRTINSYLNPSASLSCINKSYFAPVNQTDHAVWSEQKIYSPAFNQHRNKCCNN